jgi:hypothetical protein
MAKKRKVPVMWRRSNGRSKRRVVTHVGIEPGAPALCGRAIPAGSIQPLEGTFEEAARELCGGCAKRLRGVGPWTDEDGWIRAVPDFPQPYIGDSNEAWRLNELTWQRVVALAKGLRMTRWSVVELGRVALEMMEDPNRKHVARALDAKNLAIWATMVHAGWWPEAGLEDEVGPLLWAWYRATVDDEEVGGD